MAQSGPTIWLGGPSRVLHYPSTNPKWHTTACGGHSTPVTPIPPGKFTTCQRCRTALGL